MSFSRWQKIVLAISMFVLIGSLFVHYTTYNPAPVESTPVVCRGDAPSLKPGQHLKIMTWNIEYLAGKNYVFYYDMYDYSGPDTRPSAQDVAVDFKEVMRVIKDENPDILQLQEVNVGSKNTDYDDQLTEIFNALPPDYHCQSSVWYWHSPFMPHVKVLGAVGLKLAVFSKYKIASATRYQLAIPHPDPVHALYNMRRAVLETTYPVEGSSIPFYAMDTHMDAFAQGDNTMERQVDFIKTLVDLRTSQHVPWVLSGDFNLLPPGNAYALASPHEKLYYNPKTEIAPLYNQYPVVPTYDEVNGPDRAKWFTHYPNDPEAKGPSRTIDYIFYSPLIKAINHYVRQYDTLKISDHEPLILDFTLPNLP